MPEFATSSDHPLISVVMPVYNAEQYVGEAISSILAQTYSNFEFIIVDDGSTDGSVRIVREFAAQDARIRPLFLQHTGKAPAANAGIALARGGWVARMDADDIALPHRFDVQLHWIRQTGVDICGSCVKRFGVEDNLWWFPETHAAIQAEMLFRCSMLQPTVLMRAEIAKGHPFDEQCHFEDYELWTRLGLIYRMGNVPQVLQKYRTHPRQDHVVNSGLNREDMRKYRPPYFHALFPEATGEDYSAIYHLAEKESFPDLASLERAGQWLLHLAQTPDRFLRRRMADRWYAACLRSAHLGMECYRLYEQVAPEFGMVSQKPYKLWLACAVQLKSGSRLEAWLKPVWNAIRHTRELA